jgi:hypothetical protein
MEPTAKPEAQPRSRGKKSRLEAQKKPGPLAGAGLFHSHPGNQTKPASSRNTATTKDRRRRDHDVGEPARLWTSPPLIMIEEIKNTASLLRPLRWLQSACYEQELLRLECHLF